MTDIVDAYEQGYDCGKNGANYTNCHFELFSCPEKTKAWEDGKKAGEEEKVKEIVKTKTKTK